MAHLKVNIDLTNVNKLDIYKFNIFTINGKNDSNKDVLGNRDNTGGIFP